MNNEKQIIKISFRDVESYIGNPYHETIPYPTNTVVPENGDPFKFSPFGNASSKSCPDCKVKLLREPNDKRKMDTSNYYCPECDSRFSHKQMQGREYSQYAMTPGTLNFDSGSNTNNEAGGVMYHREPYANQDTFSGNLGQ